MKLHEFVVRRLLLLIPVIVGVVIFTFSVAHLIPADPAATQCGDKCGIIIDYTDDGEPITAYQANRERLGMNEGVDVQFNAPDPGIGDVITVDLPGGATQEFVWIKPGGFLMGSPTSDQLRNPDEEPRHVITISREFWMGRLVRSRRSAVPLADRGGMGIRLPGGDDDPLVFWG